MAVAYQAASNHLCVAMLPPMNWGDFWRTVLGQHPNETMFVSSTALNRPVRPRGSPFEPLIGSPCDAAGVLDLVDDRVTHLFCPSRERELPLLHGRPSQSCAWTVDGQYFCTGGWPVRILDSRPSPLAACAVPAGQFARVSATLQSSNCSVHQVCWWPADDIAGSPEDRAPGRASVAMAVTECVSALDVCRTTDSIVAGTVQGDMLLLSQQGESMSRSHA